MQCNLLGLQTAVFWEFLIAVSLDDDVQSPISYGVVANCVAV